MSAPAALRMSAPAALRMSAPATLRMSAPATLRMSAPATLRMSAPAALNPSHPQTDLVCIIRFRCLKGPDSHAPRTATVCVCVCVCVCVHQCVGHGVHLQTSHMRRKHTHMLLRTCTCAASGDRLWKSCVTGLSLIRVTQLSLFAIRHRIVSSPVWPPRTIKCNNVNHHDNNKDDNNNSRFCNVIVMQLCWPAEVYSEGRR
jgi:hypothetical protein